MRTVELMIVFGALMAIVAVVAIAIDWVGKPLRGRRFIPRVYRFDDEIEPVITRRSVMAGAAPPPMAMPVGAGAAPPPLAARAPQPSAGAFSSSVAEAAQIGTVSNDWEPNPTIVSVPAVEIAAPSLAVPQPLEADAGPEDWDQLLQSRPDGDISGVDPASTQQWSPAVASWDVSMPLDAVIADQRPTPIDKAERFWKSTAATVAANQSNSHFDAAQTERMQAGRAPNRLNPRTGRYETPELLGLRAASQPAQVQVFWPGDAIDPWSAQ